MKLESTSTLENKFEDEFSIKDDIQAQDKDNVVVLEKVSILLCLINLMSFSLENPSLQC